MLFPLAMLSQYIFGPALFLLSTFIVLIILLQRGRGGGLTGALGGAGGASAFGVKAGDIFTRITAVSVLLWIVLCALTCYWYLPLKLDIEADPSASSSSGASMGSGDLDPASSGLMPQPGTSDVPAIPATQSPPPAIELPAAATPTTQPAPAATEPPAGLPPAAETPSTETPSTETAPTTPTETPVPAPEPTAPATPEPTEPKP